DDLKGAVQGAGCPGDQLAGVPAVGPDQADAPEPGGQPPQQVAGGVAGLHGGGGHQDPQDHQDQAEGIGGDVPLAALDFLPGVIPAAGLGHSVGGLHRLGVDDRRGRAGAAAGQHPDLAAQLIVHSAGGAAGLPRPDVAVDGAPVGQVGGQRPPYAPVVDQVADGIDDAAAAVGARAAAPAGQPARRGQ